MRVRKGTSVSRDFLTRGGPFLRASRAGLAVRGGLPGGGGARPGEVGTPRPASGCTGTPSRHVPSGGATAPGPARTGLGLGLGRAPGARLRGARRAGAGGSPAVGARPRARWRRRPRWRWRGRPRVRVTWYEAGSHLATNTNREERPPRERQRPQSPRRRRRRRRRPGPPRATRRRRRRRARVTNARGDREPRAPDPWHPAADGDCRGTLVQPPAQPVIETYTQPLDTACPSSSTLPFLDEPSPESLLPRLLEESAPAVTPAASSASETELASSHMDLSQM